VTNTAYLKDSLVIASESVAISSRCTPLWRDCFAPRDDMLL